MAKSRVTNEGDDNFQCPVEVENGNENGEQLLQVQLGERHNEATAENPLGRNRNVYPDELADVHVYPAMPSGQLFFGKGQYSDKRFEFERQGRFGAVSDDGYFQRERANSQYIGLLSGTTTKTYPRKAGIAVTLRGICFQQNKKPKLIGNTVVVYKTIKQNSQFYPTVLYFTTENEIGTN